jgi:ketose-bisphosphate aldolase
MLLNGKQIKEVLGKAREGYYALGAFNVGDYTGVEMVLRAAEATGTPIILQIGDFYDPNAPETGPMRMSAFEAANYIRFTRDRAAASPIPVDIHLDHCRTYEGCIRAIQNGAGSVMIDASMKPFDENVELTKKVIEAAHACNVAVEAEIGHVSGHPDSPGVEYTTVETAVKFYEATHVDFLAVSIGTCHGIYKTEPVLKYDLITEIRKAIPVPLVMHGSSGLAPIQFSTAVEHGISKVNFATYLGLNAGKGAVKAVQEMDPERPNLSRIVNAGMKAGTDYLIDHIGYFGTEKCKL